MVNLWKDLSKQLEKKAEETSAAHVMKQLLVNMDMSGVDRVMLTNSSVPKSGYAPASAEIVGILKTMKDEMTARLDWPSL